jgi:hypothetical protein
MEHGAGEVPLAPGGRRAVQGVGEQLCAQVVRDGPAHEHPGARVEH